MSESQSRSAAATPPAPRPTAAPAPSPPPTPARPAPAWRDRLPDAILVAAFLALVAVYGVFPVKDVDIWWHLKGGRMILESGRVPRVDNLTFASEGQPWIDLHWLFQIACEPIHSRWGIPGLNVAKILVTVAALSLLLGARRPGWPLWVAVLGWLPALFILSGRMYVRPETLTLLYLSAYLAILFRARERPRLLWALPAVQVLWVNSQGLFVLGPFILAVWLFEAVLSRGAFAPGAARWWRTALGASALAGLACLANPYGIDGALFPLRLLGTMNDPVFSQSIAELWSIPRLIEENALGAYPEGVVDQLTFLLLKFPAFPFILQVHVAAVALAFASFLPLWWLSLKDRFSPGKANPNRSKPKAAKKTGDPPGPGEPPGVRPFRLVLVVVFTYLSWKATRNSHQFAAIAGTVTAWNLAEWAARVRPRPANAAPGRPRRRVAPVLAALALVAANIAVVLNGSLYALANEGRTVGIGEEPLWYPREAVKFAGRPGMPMRFLSYHDGHSSLYVYEHGPERKAHSDTRLEVLGPERFRAYAELKNRIAENRPGWNEELAAMQRPAVLADHAGNSRIGARFLAHPSWRCVWFDPVAAVYVHETSTPANDPPGVDFGSRLFADRSVKSGVKDEAAVAESLALAAALKNYATWLAADGAAARARPMLAWGSARVAAVLRERPDRFEAWKARGQIESTREESTAIPGPDGEAPVRLELPFAVENDLPAARGNHAFRRAEALAPRDAPTRIYHAFHLRNQGLPEEERAAILAALDINPSNRYQQDARRTLAERLKVLDARLADSEPRDDESWNNRDELEARLRRLLRAGRAEAAVQLLESSFPDRATDWNRADLLASLHLRLGRPARARDVWAAAPEGPRPGDREARVGWTFLVEENHDAAIAAFRDALRLRPDSFEAAHPLAVAAIERGDPENALRAAKIALASARDNRQRRAAAAALEWIEPAAEAARTPAETGFHPPRAPDANINAKPARR